MWDHATWTVDHACGFCCPPVSEVYMVTLFWVCMAEQSALSSLLRIDLFSFSLLTLAFFFFFFKTPNKTGQVDLKVLSKSGGR